MTDTRDEFTSLLWIFGGVTAAVFVIIVLLVAVTVFRSRRRSEDPGWRSEWPRAEALYAVGLAVIVAALVAFTFRTESKVDDVSGEAGLEVAVTAFQWQWRFEYPGGFVSVGSRDELAELVVPEDTTVRFRLIARDVVHSFWIPYLRFKRDAFPDHTTEFQLVFPDAGTYTGRCAEFCGLRHANMDFDVVVLPREQFDAWLAERSTG
jgi:cytochrome c oxidase subunit 2